MLSWISCLLFAHGISFPDIEAAIHGGSDEEFEAVWSYYFERYERPELERLIREERKHGRSRRAQLRLFE